MRLVALGAASLLLAFSPVRADAEEDVHSGNALHRICDVQTASAFDLGVCVGRIDGFTSGYGLSTRQEPLYCPPDRVTTQQYIDIARAYLVAHPERRQANWGLLVLHALNEAWPCPAGGKIIWDIEQRSIRVLPR